MHRARLFTSALLGSAFLTVASCAVLQPRPTLLAGIDRGAYETITARLNERLEARYPVGSSEADLIAALRTDHFTVRRDLRYATASWSSRLLIEEDLVVSWTAANGDLTSIHGLREAIGP